MPSDSQPSSSNQMTQGLESGHQPDSTATQPLTPGGALTPGAISAAVKTELNLIPKAEIDSRSTPHQVGEQVFKPESIY